MHLWRAFPYDPDAKAGQPFSKDHVPQGQGSGRFDLSPATVLYLAEDPEHAVAEKIARYRGVARLRVDHLMEFGRPLALVKVEPAADVGERIVDLCDPARLIEFDLRPDRIVARDTKITQAIARAAHDQGYYGLRWWSALIGEWHTTVLFGDKVRNDLLGFGEVELLGLDHPAVLKAAEILGIRV